MLETLLTSGSKAIYLDWSGPGSKIIEYGNMELGIFGEVSETELFTQQDLTRVGLPSDDTPIVWLKVIYQGTVLYIPKRYTKTKVMTWSSLYRLGLIFGVNSYGSITESFQGVNQYTPIYKNEHNFIIRALHGDNDGVPQNSEFNTLLYNLTTGSPNPVKNLSYPRVPWAEFLGNAANSAPLADVSASAKPVARNRSNLTLEFNHSANFPVFLVLELIRGRVELTLPEVTRKVYGLTPVRDTTLSISTEAGGLLKFPDRIESANDFLINPMDVKVISITD